MPWGRRDRGGEGVSRSANETLTGSPSARPAHSAAVGSGRWALARVSTPLRLRVSTHRRRGGLPVRTAHSPLAAPLLAAGVRGLHWARGSCCKEQAGQWARGTAGDRDSHARGAFGGSEVPGRPLEGGVPLSPLTPRTPCLASAHTASSGSTSASCGSSCCRCWPCSPLACFPARGSDTANRPQHSLGSSCETRPEKEAAVAPEAGGGDDAPWGRRSPGLEENPLCADGQEWVRCFRGPSWEPVKTAGCSQRDRRRF